MSNLKSGFEPLVKIEYNSITEFLRDINKNFAIIQNSPLLKGIPGVAGADGAQGKPGLRGSSLLFVDTKKFIKYFKNNGTANQITLEWLNNNRSTSEKMQNIALALGVDYIMHNDLIVLVDSKIIRYDAVDNIFIDTNKRLNGNNEIQMNIEATVADTIAKEIVKIKSSALETELIKRFESEGRNIVGSGLHVNDALSNSTLIYPEAKKVQVFDSGSNVDKKKIATLKHFFYGIETDELSTQVVGGTTRLLRVLKDALSDALVTTEGTINRDALPSLILVQNDANSGLLIGNHQKTETYKNNIHKFASIYKNFDDELIIKSHNYSGTAFSPNYSILKLRADQMHYNKDVVIDGDIKATSNLILSREISSKYLRSGKFITNASNSTVDEGNIEIGVDTNTNWLRFVNKRIQYKHFKNGLLGVNAEGWLELKSMLSFLPTNTKDRIPSANLNGIVLGSTINKIMEFIDTNRNQFDFVVKKSDLANGYSEPAKFTGNELIFGPINVNKPNVTIDGNNYSISFNGNKFKFNNVTDAVLYTNAQGLVQNDLKILSLDLWKTANPTLQTVQSNSALKVSDDKRLVTGKHFNWLLEQFNTQAVTISNNFYTKNELSESGIHKIKANGAYIFPGVSGDTNLTIYTVPVEFNKSIKLKNLDANKFLTTDNSKNVVTVYTVLPRQTTISSDLSTPSGLNNPTMIATGETANWLLEKIKYFGNLLTTAYPTKQALTNGEVGEIRTSKLYSQMLTVGNNLLYAYNDTINLNAGEVKIKNTTNKEKLLSVSASGVIEKKYDIDTNAIDFAEGKTTTTPTTAISPNTWNTQYNLPSIASKIADAKIITGNIFKYLTNVVYDIRKRLANTFNKQETITEMYKHLPAGSIIMWSYESSLVAGIPGQIPSGWAICNGQNNTPDMRNCMVRMESDDLNALGQLTQKERYGGRARTDLTGKLGDDLLEGWTEDGIALRTSMIGSTWYEKATGKSSTSMVNSLHNLHIGNTFTLEYTPITDTIDNVFAKTFGENHVKGGQTNNIGVQMQYPTRANSYAFEIPNGTVTKRDKFSRVYTALNKHQYYHQSVLRACDTRFSAMSYDRTLMNEYNFTNNQRYKINDRRPIDSENVWNLAFGVFTNPMSINVTKQDYTAGTLFDTSSNLYNNDWNGKRGTFVPLNLNKSFDELSMIVRDVNFFGGGMYMEQNKGYHIELVNNFYVDNVNPPGIGEENFTLYSGDSARDYRWYASNENKGRLSTKSFGINHAARVKLNDLMTVFAKNMVVSRKNDSEFTTSNPKVEASFWGTDFNDDTKKKYMLPYPKYFKVIYIMKLAKPNNTANTDNLTMVP